MVAVQPSNYSQNEAWLLFQLNDAPVQTEEDGDFNAIAIMEVATGMIFGVEMVAVLEPEISEFQARKLLNSAKNQAGALPQQILVPTKPKANQLMSVAEGMGINIARHAVSEIEPLIREATEGFAAHISGGRNQ